MTDRATLRSSRISTFTLAITAFLGLTAAKGGCNGTVITPEPIVPPSVCQVGYHVEEQCFGGSTGTGCTYESYGNGDDESGNGGYLCDPVQPAVEECSNVCVPDACPAGSELIEVCSPSSQDWAEGGTTASTSVTTGGGPDIMPLPAPGECHYECVPSNPCGSGFHYEQMCDPTVLGFECPDDADCVMPEPSCHSECTPDICPPGTREERVCYDDDCVEGEDCIGGGCEIQCIPDHDCGGEGL